jgi:hypothetical protein
MSTTTYNTAVRFSEPSASKHPLFSAGLDPRDQLLGHLGFREEVQAAIYHLIRGYETTTGLSVTRLEYDPREGRVAIEALPL